MKRAILIVSTALTLASLCYLAILTANWNPAATRAAGAFRSLPPGTTRAINFDWSALSLRHFTERERRDQAIDWTLLSILSQSGMDTREIEKVTFDLPPVRAGYLTPIANFEYGPWRARDLGKGRVLALVPKQDSKKREQTLAQIADEARKNTAKIPKTISVFEYRLAGDYQSATVMRLPDVDAAGFFHEGSGYHQATVQTAADLDAFVRTVNDLTYVGVDDGHLVLGGRSTGAKSEDISVDDVAALWQSAALLKKTKDEIDAFDAKWKSATYRTQAEKRMLDLEYEREKAELEKSIPADRRVESSGFSLDPTFDYEGLSGFLSAYRSKIQLASGASDTQFEKIQEGLRHHNSEAFYDFLDNLNQNQKGQLADAIDAAARKYALQAARYDGSLQGTRVGMTLFYTDLLAKLKAIDFWQHAPVEDFVPLTRVNLSPVFDADLKEHSATRLWFGTLDRGFQQSESNMLFAHQATRIYAASANVFTPGKEVEPNAESAQFLGWWNNHYEEVAAVEPQYERLNQIMKWSVAVQWLEKRGQLDRMSFLSDVKVDRSNWFPDWAAKNPQLKFTNWNRVQFFSRGYKGTRTETLPVLKSAVFYRHGRNHWLSGGVSLARDEIFERAPIPKNLGARDEALLRSDLNYTFLRGGKLDTLETLEKTRYEFLDSSILTRPRAAAKLRSTESELKNVAIERDFEQSADQLNIGIKIGDHRAGEVSTSSSGDTILVKFQELELDKARDIAEDVSSAIAREKSPLTILRSNSDIQRIVALDCDNCYAVKLRASDRWIRLSPEKVPQADLAPELDARVAAMQDNAPVFAIRMVPDDAIVSEARSARYIAVGRSDTEDPGAVMRITSRGPPAGSQDIRIRLGSDMVDGFQAPDGTRYVATDRLPNGLNSTDKLAEAIRDAGGTHPPGGLEEALGNGRHGDLLKQIIDDPANAKDKIRASVTRSKAEAEDALRRGDDAVAKKRLEFVAYFDDQSPWVSADKGLADLRTHPDVAAREIQEALQSRAAIPTDVFETIKARLNLPDLDPVDRWNLHRAADMMQMREMLRASRLGDTVVAELREGGKLDFHLRLTEQLHATPIDPNVPVDGNRPLYVLDNPSFANLDPAIVMRIAHDPTIARDLGPTVQLPRWDIGGFRPRMIETADGQQWVRVGDMPERARSMYHPTPLDDCSDGQQRDSQDDSCPQTPYVVEVKSPA